jgi:hypothetical protein
MIPVQATITTPTKYDRFANAVEMFVISLFFLSIGTMLLFAARNLLIDLLSGNTDYPHGIASVIARSLGGLGCWLKAYVWFPVPTHQLRRMHKTSLAAQDLEELDQLDIVNTLGSLLFILLLGEVFLLSPFGDWESNLIQAAILLWIGVPRIKRLYRAIQTQREHPAQPQ